MADEQTVSTETQATEAVTNVAPPVSNPFEDSTWVNTPITEVKKEEEAPPAATTEEKKTEQAEQPQFDFKATFGWDSVDAGKAEIEELRKLKASATTPEEKKFANEQSEKIYKLLLDGKEDDVYSVLHEKKLLDKHISGEVTESNAADIVKLSMQKKSNGLTNSEIEFLFNKKFSLPEKPIQDSLEDEADYQAKVSAWEKQVSEKKMELMIEAKLAKPELEKLKAQITLPDIPGKQQDTQVQPTQEELEAAKKYADAFLENAKKTVTDFAGFTAQVEDKDVKIPLSYGLSAEDKAVLTEKIDLFAQEGFNANAIFVDRWLNKDKSINTEQMTKDLSSILFSERATQKFVADAANKRLEIYLKEKKNINVNETKQVGDFKPDGEKTEQEKVADFFFSV